MIATQSESVKTGPLGFLFGVSEQKKNIKPEVE
jgi:hypothetical protein